MTTKNTLMNWYSSSRNAGKISPKMCGSAGEEFSEDLRERREAFSEDIRERREELSEDIRERREEFTEDIRAHMEELLEHYRVCSNHSSKLHKRIVKAFPHMHSSRYSNALKDLQDYLRSLHK